MQETEQHRIAKLFPNGGSKAVRLPKAFLTEDMEEVYIIPQGDGILLRPKRKRSAKDDLSWKEFWKDYFKNAPLLDDDFLIERGDAPPQNRDFFHE